MASELDVGDFESKLYPSGARYVDTDMFSVQTPYSERNCVVGFVGRLDEKNVRTLAQAARDLPDNITFWFVGDGPLCEELETLTQGYPRIEFTGWVDHDEIPSELNRMRLLVLPSHPTEGLPTTILESLACGTPVLSTPVSGIPDIVREGETGFLLREVSSAGVSNAIGDVLTRSDLKEMSTAGRNLIESEYSYSAAVERYRDILNRVNTEER